MEGIDNRILFQVAVIFLLLNFSECASVSSLTPSTGSENGGCLVTIYGNGFAKSQFNFGEGNSNLGNTVSLVSETQQFNCPIHKDGTNEKQIQCTTPPLKEGTYRVRVAVDGVDIGEISSNIQFSTSSANTPTITSVQPRSGPPGTIVKLCGKIFTDMYGSNQEESSNGRKIFIKRVYVGGQSCELKKDKDTLHGIDLEGDEGCMKCKIDVNGTRIGNLNTSFILSGDYGRSKSNGDYVVSRDQLYMFQTYSEIVLVSPSSGSEKGGTLISIEGNNFDETLSKPVVMVGGTPCTVKGNVTKSLIMCETAAKPTSIPTLKSGNRGLKYETWNKTVAAPSEGKDLDSSEADYSGSLDAAHYDANAGGSGKATRLSGFFAPPIEGDYLFSLQSHGAAELHLSTDNDRANMVKIVSSQASTSVSDRITLSKTNKYYLEVYDIDGTSVNVSASCFNSTLTSAYTNYVKAEVHKIKVTSNTKPEKQNIKPQGFVTGTSTYTVQEITVEESVSGAGGGFRLSLYSTVTDLISFKASSSVVATAIKDHAIFEDGNGVTVTDEPTSSGGIKYTVTFKLDWGDFPTFDIEAYGSLIVTTSKKTAGITSGGFLSLSFSGVKAPPVAVGASPDVVKVALERLFSTRCPLKLSKPSKKTLHYTFEEAHSTPSYNLNKRYSQMEAFCGRYVLKNPKVLFQKEGKTPALSLTQSPVLCFAHQGAIGTDMTMNYQYTDSESNTQDKWVKLKDVITSTSTMEWEYSCVNVFDALQAKVTGGSRFYLKKAAIEGTGDIYIDEVYLGKEKPTTDGNITMQRLRQPKLNGKNLIDNVVVEGNSTSYDVTLFPQNCGDNFPLFTSEQKPEDATVTVTRLQGASPKIDGTFDLEFLGSQRTKIPIDITAEELAGELSTINGNDDVSVIFNGICSNFNWTVTYNSLVGDQSIIKLDPALTGDQVSMTASTEVNGHVLWGPIPGEFLSAPHDKPQVTTLTNGIPTRCSGTCDFEWLASRTPTVTNISPGTGQSGTVATITGTGFSATSADNSVMLGGVACEVTSSTSTSISCTLGSTPAGTHMVGVNVAGFGLAHGSDVNFICSAGIISFLPASSTLGGGVNLTLTGHGFRNDAMVTVGGQPCPVISNSPGQLVCVIPPRTSAGSVTVVLAMTGVATITASDSFTYDSAITGQISSISHATSSVKGGEVITITGSGFGSSGSLIIGSTVVSPVTFTDTMVSGPLPSLSTGGHAVKVLKVTGAAVLSSTVPTIQYILKVESVYPRRGSLYGGTNVTITGQGLDAEADVKVGGHCCDVDAATATATQIVCTICYTGRTHQIDNSGSDPVYGTGYSWNPKNLVVNIGDEVRWRWDVPQLVGTSLKVEQVRNATSKDAVPYGFSSGPAGLPSGWYDYSFNAPGRKYYWSGPLNSHTNNSVRGSINVERLESYVGDVSVHISGKEADYDITSGVSDPPGPCQGSLCTISGCEDPEPTGGDPTNFRFKFWSCQTPNITAITPNQGTANENIVITGNGFSSTRSENKVMFGEASCIVSEFSTTELKCKLDSTTSPPISVRLFPDVIVENMGSAIPILEEKNRTFTLVPVVSSFSPILGSLEGNTQLTIVGAGFQGSHPDEDVTVTIGSNSCPITQLSYTSIVCSAPKSNSDGPKAVEVKVKAVGQMVTAECDANPCDFNYDLGSTASVASVSPTSVDGSSTTLTITGKRMGGSTSDVSVTVGGEVCTVTDADTTIVKCTISAVPVGAQPLVLDVAQKGRAKHDPSPVTVTSQSVISSVSPVVGSTNGGTVVTILGNGFTDNTRVTIDSIDCPVASVSLSKIVFTTAAHSAANDLDLIVASGGTTYAAEKFSFTVGATPVISSVSPTSGSSGDTVTLSGTNFGATIADNAVTLGGRACTLTSATTTEIVCTVGDYRAGTYELLVNVTGRGLSNNDKMFTSDMTASSILPNTGSRSGGQAVTILGTGFDDTTTATICSEPCVKSTKQESTATQFFCVTPVASGTTTPTCSVVVTVNSITRTLSYTYDSTITTQVTGVTPTHGGTGGGTTITITGSGFGTSMPDCFVSINGSECTVRSVSGNEIVCETGSISKSVKDKVRVEIGGNGEAEQVGAEEFHYVDFWSSVYTWGGGPLPGDGDFVIIQPGQTIYLDTTTAILKILLIQGGQVIVDDSQDLELNAEIILITDGGLLQVGTEENPFSHKMNITLHGHVRSKELPIYGTKVLAVREGTLDLHGKPTLITWTMLAETAAADTDSINLEKAVDWNIGDTIVIATTGNSKSQIETEQKTIKDISDDKRTLTLDSNLKYTHSGVTKTFGTGSNTYAVDIKAEVGLLTHNVKVQGSRNGEWSEKIEACPDGFNVEEFATQTCFQGRFGEETGSDQFGGHIIIHSPTPDSGGSKGRISYVELDFMGQAFRLGRYPIHFHLLGDKSKSYVRGVGIHETFNRAVNIHATHNVLIEHTVVYNIMGGAIFLEDGIETGNIIQYNLALFVKQSTSLLNDDVTPAGFWATNPNNTIQHCHAAGGSHFGFWYSMHEHPKGPSFTTTVCPTNVPLGIFYNNTAHSLGWFGLWIFPTFTPKVGGGCDSTNQQTAHFRSFNAWHNDKGVEMVNTGYVQLSNFYATENLNAQIEIKILIEPEGLVPSNGALIKDSLVVCHASLIGASNCTKGGIVIPYGPGLLIDNVTFVNFDRSDSCAFSWARIDGTCGDNCVGSTHKTAALTFINSPRRVCYEWLFEGVLEDLDGTLCSSANCKVIPTTGTLPPSCGNYQYGNTLVPVSKCQAAVKFHRFGFNNLLPNSAWYKDVLFTNAHGVSAVPFKDKRITNKNGWVAQLVSGETYTMTFNNSAPVTNISFTGQMDDVNTDDFIILVLPVKLKPDRLKINEDKGFIVPSETPLDTSAITGSSWYFNDNKKEVEILISGKDLSNGGTRKKRSSPSVKSNNQTYPVNLQAYTCFYTNCTPPPDPNTVPPAATRPTSAVLWSSPESWSWLGNTLPVPGSDLTIPSGVWMVADMAIPWFKTVVLYGTIEFDHGTAAPYRNIDLNATHVIILGGRLIIGWPDDPFLGDARVILRGNSSSAEYDGLTNAATVGAKAMGVFGGLDLHGIDGGVTWTRLASSAFAGDSQITLAQAVDWAVGSEIVVAPTGYEPREAETFMITSVSTDKQSLTLNSSLQYNHVVIPKENFYPDLGAEVALLTRNVKVIGESYANLYQESFGARILVGIAQEDESVFIGFARITNTEFYHTGQEGWTESYDARYSIAFLDAGAVNDIKPSIIEKNAFHDGFSPAIGVFGTHSLAIRQNVIHHTITRSIETSSDNTNIESNLLILMLSEATYQNRYETENIRLSAAIEAQNSKNSQIRNNVVAGSERASFWLNAMECNSAGHGSNLAHSSIMGFVIYPQITTSATCLRMSNFTAWKNLVGIYYQNTASLELWNNFLVENRIGAAMFVMGPSAVDHQATNKSVTVKNTTLVGASSSYDCATDKWIMNEAMRVHSQALPWNKDGTNIGIFGAQYSQSTNGMSMFPYFGTMSYPSIYGITILENVTFANFGQMCGKENYAITSSAEGDDGQHPVQSSNVILKNVQEGNKLFFYRPNVRKINGADCGDMDCDGMKANIFCDTDGTFFGEKGCAVSESEWEWDGDARRGLGDYRIPKAILNTADGTRIPVDQLAPHKGIIRSDTTVYKSAWHAHLNSDLNYKMLIIESMDADTETRRVSPVAILGDGYLNLINGPQDHGWCSGYTCRERLSTFMAVVATGKEFVVVFTGTTPQHLRFFLLNCDETHAIKVAVWYSQPYEMEVSVDSSVISPKNARTDDDGNYLLEKPSFPGEYTPTVSDTSGQNYFDRNSKRLYVTIRGPKTVELKTKPSIYVSCNIPPMTEDEFFGSKAPEYLAAFFDIPPEKIRKMNVISESQSKRRRKRSTVSYDVMVLEISDVPNSNSTALSAEQLENMVDKITNEIQLGNISQVLNMTVNGVSVAGPPPSPGSPEWNSTTVDDSPYTVIVEAAGMRFNPAPEPQHEGVVFKTQPKIQVLDPQGRPITQLGSASQPWEITASLRPGGSNPLATLTGNLTVQFVNGWANFTSLLITKLGTEFHIDFNLTVPTGSNFSITSGPLTVAARPIKASVTSMTSTVIENHYFAVGVELQDNATSERIPDIAWRGLAWTMTAELNMPELNPGSMLGPSETLFSTSSSTANFYSLNFTSLGIYAVKLHVYTTPSAYDFYEEVQVIVRSQDQTSLVIEKTSLLEMRFDADFDTVVGANTKPFASMMASRFIKKYLNVLFDYVSVEPGSIVVKFSISGGVSNLNTTVHGMCESVQNDSSFTFNSTTIALSGYLTVDGVSYYGVHCGPIASPATTKPESAHDKTSMALIVSLVVVSVTLLVTILAIILWKCKVAPKTKTRDLKGFSGYYNQPNTIEDILFREQSFMSIREKSTIRPQAPAATSIHSIGNNFNSEKSPLPF
ncbi:fibrocystin-L-like isoform X2 [Mizuhopecten yessoensis]|uniref:fibrocystin-L-like isoform X2 n=1 Tax=Mizuhopecten yessoensis TaxID=6573 RepID=UPI000B45B8EE|nr:fibrocystin-L-like isoform X2 [Mizuhopecten yessoensis]